METSLLYKYKPKFFKDFIIEPNIILLLKSFINLNHINLIMTRLLCKVHFYYIICEYYGTKIYHVKI